MVNIFDSSPSVDLNNGVDINRSWTLSLSSTFSLEFIQMIHVIFDTRMFDPGVYARFFVELR